MLAAEQGAGRNTLDAYRRDLADFSEFLAGRAASFAGADTQRLRDYLADLDARGFKSTTIARRLSAMVCFVNVESVDRIIYSIFQRFNLEWKTRTLRVFTQAA